VKSGDPRRLENFPGGTRVTLDFQGENPGETWADSARLEKHPGKPG